MINNSRYKSSPSQFLATEEKDVLRKLADVNVGRRLKNSANQEDRIAPRRKLHMRIKIGLASEKEWLEGTLKDISLTGAMVQVENGLFASKELLLYDEEAGKVMPCVLARNTIDRIGVKFSGKPISVYPRNSAFFSEISLETFHKMMKRRKRVIAVEKRMSVSKPKKVAQRVR